MVPALLLFLFAAWCGTFFGSATAAGSTVGAVVLLGMVATVGVSWRDPLRLGRLGRLLPPALWIVAAVSAWRSPVPRASWMTLLLLPAFLLLPGAVARCWNRLSSRAITVVVLGVSLWALIDYKVRDLPRVAMPLGQHNLLAAWLVILLPLALLTAREPGIWRWLGLASGFLAAVTILATLSLAGNLALASVAVIALLRGRRSWTWILVLVAAVGLFSQRERIASILAGQDLSVQGRMVYYEGALEGFRERPWLGWGPGSAAWTAGAFLDPVPGVSPFGESVGELHSLPLHLGYEIGAVGLVLALALGMTFLMRRRQAADPALLFAGKLGLLGGAVASVGSAALAVTALPVAAAVAAGAALSALGEKEPPARRAPILFYVLMAAVGLAPLETARWLYERQDFARAMQMDPNFPLYWMRPGLLQKNPELALGAAWKAPGVATLWTVAGIEGAQGAAERRPWADEALERACRLDPFNPFPPFYRMTIEPNPRYGAHALLAEPRLAAATFWETHPDLLARSVEELRRWPGVDAGWKEALIAALPSPEERRGPTAQVELEIDTEPSLALSLHTFRRRPFPVRWPLVQVRLAPLERLQMPPATTLPGAVFTNACSTRERSPGGQRVRIR